MSDQTNTNGNAEESNHESVTFVPFSEEQRELIAEGDVRMTVRTDRNAETIGLEKGEIGYMLVEEKPFAIKCAGKGTIDQIGGLEKFKAMALGGDKLEPSYKTTMRFMLGYTNANIYTLKELDEMPTPLAEYLAEKEAEEEDSSEEETIDSSEVEEEDSAEEEPELDLLF